MAKGLARPIKTRRDYKAAASIARKTKQADDGEPAAERRLQALLSEIDKFDGDTEDAAFDADDGAEEMDGEFRRRWSDET